MKLNPSLQMRRIGSNYMIVKTADNDVNLTDVIRLNETAAGLWKHFSGMEFTEEDMVEWLCGEYDVTRPVATTDVHNLLTQWKEYGMLS
jgi:hypothetical protein